jgi:hypothetical protein
LRPRRYDPAISASVFTAVAQDAAAPSPEQPAAPAHASPTYA